jgi:L,D-peptidoglycan transpeptidase YkuD (ErfK/YbiS/YcfS/YnhG family)
MSTWQEFDRSGVARSPPGEDQAGARGGFNASLPLSDPNGSERLSNYPSQYGYSIVVNFNRAPDTKTPYRGAGIFVHVRAGATAGCIATSSANVVSMLRTMRPGDTITMTA